MLALTLALSLQLGAADARPEAWVVVSRRSGVAKPQALDFARSVAAALNDRGVPTPTVVDDASSCAAKVPCLVDLAQKKGVGVLITVEAGSALDDMVLHVEALSVEEFGKKLATFDFTGPAKSFQADLKTKIEEFFAPAVRNVLGLGTQVAKTEPPPPVEEKKPEPPPAEVKPEPAAPMVVETHEQPESGMSTLKIAGLGAMAVGAVLLVSSMGVGFKAMSLNNHRMVVCPAGMQCNDPQAYSLYGSAGSMQNAGIALLATGLVVAAAGAVLFFVDFGGGSSATVTPSASSDGASFVLSGRF